MAEGHRKRIREKIKSFGLDALTDAELLEYVLYAFIPRKDTSKLAHALIEDYGSLQGVMTASAEELVRYKNMTDNAANFLPLIPEFYSRAVSASLINVNAFTNPHIIKRYMVSKLGHYKEEKFLLIALDKYGRFIKYKMVGEGDTVHVTVSKQILLEFVLSTKAKKLIVGHNHPFANAYPSQSDINLAREMESLISAVGADLADHVIAGVNSAFSFRESGLLDDNGLERISADWIRHRIQLTEVNSNFISEVNDYE